MNFGLIQNTPDKRDYIFTGATDNVEYWFYNLPTREKQHSLYFDTFGCVTFAILNQLETKFNQLIKDGIMSVENIMWLNDNGYIDELGSVNFSDRFCIIQNGTTRKGNSARNVYASLQETGLIPESMLPYPREQRTPVFDIDDYFDKSVLTEEMIELGKEFLRRFEIKYFYVDPNKRNEALKDSPLLCFVNTSCTEKIGCTGTPNHAVLYYTEELKDGFMPVFDSYESNDKDFIRLMDKDYKFQYGMYSITIKENTMTNVKIIRNTAGDGKELGFYIPIKSEEAFKSQCENYGIEVPKKQIEGVEMINWEKVKIDGETNL